VVVALLLVTTGCRATQLEPESVERAVRTSLEDAFEGAEVGSARCAGVADVEVRKGESFSCAVTIDGTEVRVVLALLDSTGRMEYTPEGVLLRTADVEQTVSSAVLETTRDAVDVDCGGRSVIVGKPPVTLDCSVESADGFRQTATVTIADRSGAISWSLAADG
jgi:hypothetical protein